MKNNTYIIGCYNEDNGLISFYAEQNGRRYYIFSRRYKQTLHEYFRNGVAVRTLFSDSRAKRNAAIMNVLEQLKTHLRYAEKEYDIFMLDEHRRSRMAYRRNCIRNNDYIAYDHRYIDLHELTINPEAFYIAQSRI